MKAHRNMLAWATALGGILTTEAAVSQYAANGRPLRWNFDAYDAALAPVQNPSTLAIRYTLAAEAFSTTNRPAELNAIRAAFAQWQAISGTKVKFEEFGSVLFPGDINPFDGQNVVVWLNSNRFVNGNRTFFPISVQGLTFLSTSDTDETIAEADIVLNRSLAWTTDFNSLAIEPIFVEGVALHEIGHLLGLNHATLGGATMFWTGAGGINHSAGLSPDEITGLRALYSTPAGAATVGRLTGTVTLSGAAVLGAVVTLEDANGNVLASTPTLANGSYTLGGLPPGTHMVRVTPLDPPTSGDTYLVRGKELDVSATGRWTNANTAFLPLANTAVTISANAATTRNLAVTGGTPPFRIVEMRSGTNPVSRAAGDFCVQLKPGVAGQTVGVFVPGLTSTNVSLRLTGGGLSYGPVEVFPTALRTLTLVQVPVTVAGDAVPGLRSLALTADGFTAWANGFAEVLPASPDFNFDGLDDRFQRRYFDPFTQSGAGPEQDPDGDGFVNRREAVMGSDPTKASSVNWRITSVKLSAQGTTVSWDSAPGRKYQVYARDNLAGALWQTVGAAVTVAGESGQYLDNRPADSLRFYQVRDVP